MSGEFHKFPHTQHLLWLGPAAPRDDKVMGSRQAAEFLSHELVVEEKVDGANLGFSLGPDGQIRAQSRGGFLQPGQGHIQWNMLWPWLDRHRAKLRMGLTNDLILFGEWCYARHTVPYDRLPDWFLGFDLFSKTEGRFWASTRRNKWMRWMGLAQVPELRKGKLTKSQLVALIGVSTLGPMAMEGIYLRREADGLLLDRAKIVRANFGDAIKEHWSRRPLIPNSLAALSGVDQTNTVDQLSESQR